MHHNAAVLARYMPDWSRDRVHVALSNWHWTSNVVVGLALLAYGGIPYVLWGIFFRTTLGLHATWLVNSATHKWGSRRFDTRDDSTNNWWVALLTFGEGWHNNHHAHPTSARHGLAWYEMDSTGWRSHAAGAGAGVGRQGPRLKDSIRRGRERSVRGWRSSRVNAGSCNDAGPRENQSMSTERPCWAVAEHALALYQQRLRPQPSANARGCSERGRGPASAKE